jgi:hypothetical protein
MEELDGQPEEVLQEPAPVGAPDGGEEFIDEALFGLLGNGEDLEGELEDLNDEDEEAAVDGEYFIEYRSRVQVVGMISNSY